MTRKPRAYVFVLWGDGFDEMVATAFVTELREAGLLVKVVGLTPPQISGARGLALMPDLTLGQALPLASQTIALIIPVAARWSDQLYNDPRLGKFFEQAHSNQAKFIIGSWPETEQAGLDLPPSAKARIVVYPEAKDVVKFARELAKLLSRQA